MNMTIISNLLWDVDGTIFDTYPAITYAISKSLNEMGVSIAFNVIDRLTRRSLNHCIDNLSHRFQLDPDLLYRRFVDSYQTVSPTNQLPFPCVEDVCIFIRERGGVNAAVTHRGIESTQQLLTAHNLESLFNGIFSLDQGYPRKPNPGMVIAAIEQYGLIPEETMFIGDREIDIQAGQAAGIRTCLYGTAELSSPPNFRIDHYSQLLSLLREPENTK